MYCLATWNLLVSFKCYMHLDMPNVSSYVKGNTELKVECVN